MKHNKTKLFIINLSSFSGISLQVSAVCFDYLLTYFCINTPKHGRASCMLSGAHYNRKMREQNYLIHTNTPNRNPRISVPITFGETLICHPSFFPIPSKTKARDNQVGALIVPKRMKLHSMLMRRRRLGEM